ERRPDRGEVAERPVREGHVLAPCLLLLHEFLGAARAPQRPRVDPDAARELARVEAARGRSGGRLRMAGDATRDVLLVGALLGLPDELEERTPDDRETILVRPPARTPVGR